MSKRPHIPEILKPDGKRLGIGLAVLTLAAGVGSAIGQESAEPYFVDAQSADACAIALGHTKKGEPRPPICAWADADLTPAEDHKQIPKDPEQPDIADPKLAVHIVRQAAQAHRTQGEQVYDHEFKLMLYNIVGLWAFFTMSLTVVQGLTPSTAERPQ